MAKANNKGRTKSEPKHVRHYEWMLGSAAYRSLSVYARCLLTELKRLHNGNNNGDIFLSVRDAAERVGCHKDTAYKAFKELKEKGFIRVRERGSFEQKRGYATSWILTEFGFAGQLPTKDFMSWGAKEKNRNRSGQTGPTVLRDRTVSYQHAPPPPLTVLRDRTMKRSPGKFTVLLDRTQLVYHPRGDILGPGVFPLKNRRAHPETLARRPWVAPHLRWGHKG